MTWRTPRQPSEHPRRRGVFRTDRPLVYVFDDEAGGVGLRFPGRVRAPPEGPGRYQSAARGQDARDLLCHALGLLGEATVHWGEVAVCLRPWREPVGRGQLHGRQGGAMPAGLPGRSSRVPARAVSRDCAASVSEIAPLMRQPSPAKTTG
ncbi:hypothetical protein GCM10010350_71510 [Streptomyces galilaeus]|nr:hypothetical protein GCM10010350_71510 [Streptomyces galilaeus]